MTHRQPISWIQTVSGRGSLASAVAAVFTATTFLIGGLVATAWWVTHGVANDSVAVGTAITEVRDHAVDLALKGEAMRLHVVQVQQFLTDISATRAAEGFADGFDEAEVHAQAFRDLLTVFRDRYREQGDGEMAARLDKLGAAFDAYYQAGREMAHAYVDGGPTKGNTLMVPFDEAAAALSNELDPIIADQLTAMDEALAVADGAAVHVASGVTRVRGLGLVALLFVGLAALLLRRGVQRRVLAPLAELVAAVRRVAEGDLRVEVVCDHADELGDLAGAFNQMTGALRSSTEAVAVKVALDGASANIMVADRDRVITYMNDSAHATFERLEGELRKLFPTFRADGLVGRCIDDFYTDPARVAAILADPANLPHAANIEVGPFTFHHTSSAAFDDDGEYIATVVEWKDVTEEVRLEHETRRLVEGMISGRLDLRIDPEPFVGDEHRAQVRRMNAMLDSVAEPFFSIRAASGEVEKAVMEIAAGYQDLAGRSERQVASLENTASAMEEMASTVGQNAANAHEANELTVAAREVAEGGGTVVGEAVTAMGQIEEASGKIRDIIEVIDEIAFQTNLLSLNAAVEAARAGEQGRGFAVVAAEVRNLARRSAKAAAEIKGLIADTVEKVDKGVELVNASGERLTEILESVRKASTVVQEISTANEEQAKGVEEVNRAVAEMNGLNQQNAALITQSANSTDLLATHTRDMARQVNRFRLPDGVSATTGAGGGATVAVPPPNSAAIVLQPKSGAPATGSRALTCWEFKKCGREEGGAKAAELGVCPAYPDHGRDCAYLTGTLCGGEVQGSFATKQANCLKCDFFKSDNFEKSF